MITSDTISILIYQMSNATAHKCETNYTSTRHYFHYAAGSHSQPLFNSTYTISSASRLIHKFLEKVNTFELFKKKLMRATKKQAKIKHGPCWIKFFYLPKWTEYFWNVFYLLKLIVFFSKIGNNLMRCKKVLSVTQNAGHAQQSDKCYRWRQPCHDSCNDSM